MTTWQFAVRQWAEHGHIWLVSATLVVAAVIDGWKLKVPNWLTLPMILAGWGYGLAAAGWAGFGQSVLGTLAGLGLLLPLYAIGGMGAGDVKLLAGVGAWVGPAITLWAFTTSAVVGGLMALAMVAWSGDYVRHWVQLQAIGHEILTVRNPQKLANSA